MFTGLVQDSGAVTAVDATDDGARIVVRTALTPEIADGDSVAVNGVCLTATAVGTAPSAPTRCTRRCAAPRSASCARARR